MRRNWVLCWLLLAPAAMPAALTAEPLWVAAGYLLDRWGTADGLPVNGTSAVHISSTGYVYVATFDGLVRFDGRRFRVFDTPRDPRQPSNRLYTLAETPDGRLWMVADPRGLVVFDGMALHVVGREDGLPSRKVYTVHQDGDGRLWVGTARGLTRLAGKSFRRWAPDAITTDVRAIATGSGGRLWVGTGDQGLFELRGQSVRHRYLPGRDLKIGPIRDLALDGANDLWIGGRRGLARLHAGTIEHFPSFANRAVFNLRAAPDGSVLAQTDVGIYRWRGDRWEVVDARPAAAYVELLRVAPDGAVWTVLQDRLARNGREVLRASCPIKDVGFDATGAAWLAMQCDGLWRLHPRSVLAITAADGLPEGPVYGMSQDSAGTLWATTADGTVSAIRLRGDEAEVLAVHHTGVPGRHVGTVLADDRDRIWVGQTELCVLEDGRCTPPPGVPEPFRVAGIHALHQAGDGSIWVGGLTGLWRFDGVTWERLDQRFGLPPHTLVRGILETRHGNLWLATREDGLRRLDTAGEVARFGIEQGLSSLAVRDLYEDPGGYLWVATESHGLCRSTAPEHTPEPRFTCIGEAQGLHSNTLHRILPDGLGRLWFNTNTGVFWVEQQALEDVLGGKAARVYPRVYSEHDGLPDREGNGGVQGSGLRLQDGRLAFPGMAGIAIFDPRRMRTPQRVPRVSLESVLLPGGRELPAVSPLSLPRGERVFSIRFTGFTPGLTDPLYFRYRLGPRGDRWIDIGDERTLSFERLPPGRHRLQIIAIDAASGTAGPPATLRLHLPPYFYETRAFRLTLVLGLIAAAIAAFWRYQRVQVVRQHRLEQAVDARTSELREQKAATERALTTVESQRAEIADMAAARTRYFANVSHELRTPLTLLVGPLQDHVGGEPLSPDVAGAMLRNANRLERLVEQLLDLERLDARRFPLTPVDLDLAALARDGVAAFAPLAEREGLGLELQAPAEPVPVHADPEQLSRVLGNLLSNALKFTPEGGRVRVTLRTTQEAEAAGGEGTAQAELLVEDTGPGVPREWRERIFDRFSQMGSRETQGREGAGLGLALCREVVRLHHGRLYVEPGAGGGSRFVLRLPLAASPEAPTAGADAPGASPAPEPAARTRAAAEAEVSEILQGSRRPADASPAAPSGSGARDGHRRVLVAEDNTDLLRHIERVLAGDYEIEAVEDGEAALRAARRDPPDAIVSDILMPRRDGLQLARALRADPELAGIPLIFLTARAGDEDEIEGLATGADQYLKKPFRSDVLRARVAAAIRTCERLRDLFARRPPEPVAGEPGLPERARAWIESNAHEDGLSVNDLAKALNMSLTNLHRKMVDATGQSPGAFIRSVRLARARRLLREGAGTVSEVAYGVGFVSLSGFSRAYRETYGEPPSASLQ